MTQFVQLEKYGKTVWSSPALDAARAEHCLCHSCDRLRKDTAENCPMAAVLFALCQSVGMAVGVSRCAQFVSRCAQFVSRSEAP